MTQPHQHTPIDFNRADALNTDNTLHTLDGEKGAPKLNTYKSTLPHVWIKVFGCVLLVLILFATYYTYKKHRQPVPIITHTPDNSSVTLQSSIPKRSFNPIPPASVRPSFPDISRSTLPHSTADFSNKPLKFLPALALPMPMQEGTPLPVWMREHSAQKPSPVLDKSSSTLMVTNTSAESGSVMHGMNPLAIDRFSKPPMAKALEAVQMSEILQANAASHGDKAQRLSALLESTQTTTQHARSLGNRNFIVPKGSFIQCVLQTKIDTSVPGMTRCNVSHNVYSDNGKVVLVERGSTISGEYQAALEHGIKRVFVLWNRLKTPNGTVIDLDSPATDALGAAGLPGRVNTHFWERFGSALAMSLIDDVSKATVHLAGNTGNKVTTINLGSTTQSGQEIATETLKRTINIQPTLYKKPGDRVGVYLARDLDFSGVYDVWAS